MTSWSTSRSCCHLNIAASTATPSMLLAGQEGVAVEAVADDHDTGLALRSLEEIAEETG